MLLLFRGILTRHQRAVHVEARRIVVARIRVRARRGRAPRSVSSSCRRASPCWCTRSASSMSPVSVVRLHHNHRGQHGHECGLPLECIRRSRSTNDVKSCQYFCVPAAAGEYGGGAHIKKYKFKPSKWSASSNCQGLGPISESSSMRSAETTTVASAKRSTLRVHVTLVFSYFRATSQLW